MTRFVALQLSTSHSYDVTPAHRDFGWSPRVAMEEALERLVTSLRDGGEAGAERALEVGSDGLAAGGPQDVPTKASEP